MSSIVYQKEINGPWYSAYLSLTDEEVQEQCFNQKISDINICNKVIISDESISIKASAVLFSNGDTWDAVLSKIV